MKRISVLLLPFLITLVCACGDDVHAPEDTAPDPVGDAGTAMDTAMHLPSTRTIPSASGRVTGATFTMDIQFGHARSQRVTESDNQTMSGQLTHGK